MRSSCLKRRLPRIGTSMTERSLLVLPQQSMHLLARAHSVLIPICPFQRTAQIRLFASQGAPISGDPIAEKQKVPLSGQFIQPDGVFHSSMEAPPFVSLTTKAQPTLPFPGTPFSAAASRSTDLSPSAFPRLPPWLENILDLWKAQSGTAEVLALKQDVSLKAEAFDAASAKVVQARRHLDESLLLWERVNGQHMQLLQHRDRWNSEDARQFAALVEKEVHDRTSMELARADLTKAENALSQTQLEYMNAMRKRYHEEQIWQDQWRILSTFGTWSLIVLNSVIFLSSQFFHYRREAAKMKHLEKLIKENVASQEAFKDHIVAERQALVKAANAHNDENKQGSLFSIFGGVIDQSTKEEPDLLSTTSEMTTPSHATMDDGGLSTETFEQPQDRSTSTINDTPHMPEWTQRLIQHPLVQPVVSSGAVQATIRTTRNLSKFTASKTQALIQSTRDNVQAFTEEVHIPSVALGAGVVMVATLFLTSR